MSPTLASRTALATSLMRALHSRTAPAPLIDDVWGDRLVPDPVRQALPEAALRANAAYADVILRTRYAEDALAAAVSRGVDQYVIVGAGFDSFAHRRPAPARTLNVYEVDHPATLDLKRRCLQAGGVAESGRLQFVAADLACEDLGAALARSSFQPGRPGFFSWLGVTMYLTHEANLAALRAIATCAAPGSELVFSYVDEAVFEPGHASAEFTALRHTVASMGEAFLSGFDPARLSGQLRDAGFELLEDLNGEEMVARYDSGGVNGLRSNRAAHLAHARVN
ncbi:class I SAM-dependent methyltransferase [Sphaerotilaceae bacterium SBD11-9]